ncbi:hypothetical protein C8J57DRAFT_1321533 [Mycena rebaudengoi]|nr:hypothetical protein C8J57DRAFT_1321533 [Mycena rebaudengoi]
MSSHSEVPMGCLRQITSKDTGRYDTDTIVDASHVTISAGLFSTQEPEPSYLALNWAPHIHPEGQIYFVRSGPFTVVTEAYMYHPATSKKICMWIEHIEELVATKVAQSIHTEVFLKLEGDDCGYYFVDHETHSQFWLYETSTQDLGLNPVTSISHLQTSLRELYWHHVENFPMHVEPISAQDVDALISIFVDGQCDQMTSRVSTFPYPAQDCEKFVKLLRHAKGYLADGHTTWIISRLWAFIDRDRALHHYGQEHARLSRDQAILYSPNQHHWVSTIAAWLSFSISDTYLARLNNLFVDHIIYIDVWKSFMADCLYEWRHTTYRAFSGLILHMPFLFLPTPFPALLMVSTSLFFSSLISSIFLAHRYEPMRNIGADQAVNYLDTIQSDVFKFQFVALVFSLPKTLHLWGFLGLLANCILLAVEQLGFAVGMGLLGLACLLLLTLYCVTSETPMEACANFWSRFRCVGHDEGVELV